MAMSCCTFGVPTLSDVKAPAELGGLHGVVRRRETAPKVLGDLVNGPHARSVSRLPSLAAGAYLVGDDVRHFVETAAERLEPLGEVERTGFAPLHRLAAVVAHEGLPGVRGQLLLQVAPTVDRSAPAALA
jgi:hypothetical protein